MERILLGKQMKAVDRYSIENIGIPSMVLMERAALGVVEAVEDVYKTGDKILVVCGNGNNGADGLAVYRILMTKGYRAECVILGDVHGGTEDFQSQRKIIKKCGYKYSRQESEEESPDVDIKSFDIIVDALFGIGLSRNVEGMYAEMINQINSEKLDDDEVKVISVDAPSGVDTDNGKIMGIAVRADITVTFGKSKVGLVMYPGAAYAGEVRVWDIGIPWSVYGTVLFDSRISPYVGEEIFQFEKSDMAEYISPRIPYSHKGTYGKVLVIAGSAEYSGAAYLCESAAYKSGCGLVKVVTSMENKAMLTVMMPEGLYEFYSAEGMDPDILKEDMEWADAIIIGPGLGQSENALNMLKTVIEEKEKPIVIDADGINLLSSNRELLLQLDDNMVLTPHLREMSRLMETSVSEIKKDMLSAVSAFKRRYKGTLVLKDARTVVAGPKKELFINTTGNSGMATGGSGDVLAGIIGGIIAQDPNFDIALKSMTGVYLHGMAGDMAAEELGEYAMTASNIVDGLAMVLKECKRR